MNYYFYFYIAPCVPGTFSGATAAVLSACRRHGLAAGHRRGRVASDAGHFKSYGDPDVSNPIPPSTPSRPAGYHFGQPLLRNAITKDLSSFTFFTTEIISNIVTHTNSYAYEHVFSRTHQSYARPNDSWQGATADEIKRLIAII